MNKTADTILKALTSNTGEEYHKLHTGRQDFAIADARMRYYESRAQQALLNDILALVGPDSEQGDPVKNSIVPMQFTEVVLINEFKHELRKKIRQYFGQDNQGGRT